VKEKSAGRLQRSAVAHNFDPAIKVVGGRPPESKHQEADSERHRFQKGN